MNAVSSRRRQICAGAALAVLGSLVLASAAHAATPTGGTVGPVSGSSATWDFAAVTASGGEVAYTASTCPTAACDSFDLTVQLPEAPQDFYATYSATLEIVYTWNEATPANMDVYAQSPGGLLSGPGSSTCSNACAGPGTEVLDVVDPLRYEGTATGVYSVRSVATVATQPTPAHAVATFTYQPRVGALPPINGAHYATVVLHNGDQFGATCDWLYGNVSGFSSGFAMFFWVNPDGTITQSSSIANLRGSDGSVEAWVGPLPVGAGPAPVVPEHIQGPGEFADTVYGTWTGATTAVSLGWGSQNVAMATCSLWANGVNQPAWTVPDANFVSADAGQGFTCSPCVQTDNSSVFINGVHTVVAKGIFLYNLVSLGAGDRTVTGPEGESAGQITPGTLSGAYQTNGTWAFTVEAAADPYRNVAMSLLLPPDVSGPPASIPEAPRAAGLPLAGSMAMLGLFVVARRRRQRTPRSSPARS
ncbi:MAG: hypothetical protein ACYDAC_05055 [Candidatus Dormibacteria bacterium]